MPPGASRGASAGVLVKILKPRRISSESREASSFSSMRGFRGNSHAAFIVTVAAISGPVIAIRGAAGREHAAADASRVIMKVRLKADPTGSVWRIMVELTYHSTHHDETKRSARRPRSRDR